MAKISIESLPRDVREGLETREYSNSEVERIYNSVRNRHAQKKRGFCRAAVLLTLILIGIAALTFWAGPPMPAELRRILAMMMGGMLLLGLAIGWYSANKMTLQFLRALNLGYPELEEKFGKETFRKRKAKEPWDF